MTEYSLILEACAPESLPLVHFTEKTQERVNFALGTPDRFDMVEITAPTRAALMETVAQFWGMEDLDWFYELPFRMTAVEIRDEEPQADDDVQRFTREGYTVIAATAEGTTRHEPDA